MPIGIDMQIGIGRESTFGTRVAPTQFFEVTSEGIEFEVGFYYSEGLGGGLWRRRRTQTTQRGTGSLTMEVPTVGFGPFLSNLHGNAVTPEQQGTTTAYLQTHTLDSAPSKSSTIQIGRPPITGSVLPFDYSGCIQGSTEFSWEPAGVLMATMNYVVQTQSTAETLATPTYPTSLGLFSFQGGSITIAGGAVTDITGGGSVTIDWPLRDDTYTLGSQGKIAKPLPNDRPTATGTFEADFTDMTHYNRVVNSTLADVVLTFTGGSIVSGQLYTITITIPDCGFEQNPPTVDGPGPLTQAITFRNASATNDPPVITYKSTDTAVI